MRCQLFFTEAKAVSAVKHPGLIDVYEFGELTTVAPSWLWSTWRENASSTTLPLPGWAPIPMVIRLVRQVAAALSVTSPKSCIET